MKYTIRLSTEIEVEVDADNEDVACAVALGMNIPSAALDWQAVVLTSTAPVEDHSAYLDRPVDMLLDDDYENS